jgi:glycosyltransferase involved in cell wall biosynthesis
MPNGICASAFRNHDTAAFRLRHRLGDRPFILFMGRMNRIKGPDLLLDAFLSAADRFRDIDLVFAGPDGGLADELRRRAAEHVAGGRVRFLGYLDGDEKSQAYHAAELLVVPSRSEAMSIVALEAGICGKPVLMTDRCGFDEVAEVGGGCIVLPDVAGIAAGLVSLLNDRRALPSLGRRLSRFVAEHYAWARLATRYIELYRRLA